MIPSITRMASPGAFLDSDAASSSMRPRNRRLISTEQELVTTSGTSTPSGSRAVSPIPSKHPSRAATRAGNSAKPVGGLMVRDNGKQRSTSPAGFGGLWEGSWQSSWTALQGIASSVLGGDTEIEYDGAKDRTSGKKLQKKPATQVPGSWGPAGLPQKKALAIGTGTLAEREAAVKVRKLRGVLEGRDDDLNVQKDSNGNFKRRSSLEDSRQNGQDDEGDALVYVHHVRPQDTLAGVILRYNCQPAIFRKVNRFWPNDLIQTRKVVIVPVDATTIKGRPCEPPSPELPRQGVDLLAPTPSIEDPPTVSNGGIWPRTASSNFDTSAERSESDDEHPWVHVRWVLIDSSPSSKPVEIARMPRKTLGYFPPRRRKSQTTLSSVSTPRGSIDLSRAHTNDITNSPSSTTSRRTSNLGPRPSQSIGSYFPQPTPSSARPRRESVSEAADRLGWMRGPGGVGTMGKNVRKPGPANDGLNKWAKKHIPGLAIDSLPSTSVMGGDSAHFGFGDELGSISEGGFPRTVGPMEALTPSGGSNNGLGLENAAAAVEGWMRRLTTRGPGTPRIGGSRSDEPTDLIELLDGAGSDDGRGFELTPGSLRVPMANLESSMRDELGRPTTPDPKGGKSD